jgi:hypothetical protein
VYRTLGGLKGNGKCRGLYIYVYIYIYIFVWKGKENHQLETRFSVHHRIASAATRVEFVSVKVSYILVVLRGHLCNSILLNVHATSEGKIIIKRRIL